MILTSVQEAALNACGEMLADLDNSAAGMPFIQRTQSGEFSVFGHVDGDFALPLVSGGRKETLGEAMRCYLTAYAERKAQPIPLCEARAVKQAVETVLGEYREAGSLCAVQLDELADRIAAIPVV